jgi:hypothetical protein
MEGNSCWVSCFYPTYRAIKECLSFILFLIFSGVAFWLDKKTALKANQKIEPYFGLQNNKGQALLKIICTEMNINTTQVTATYTKGNNGVKRRVVNSAKLFSG